MGSVVVLGSYNLGITYRLGALPVWGQTVTSDQAFFSHGGKGSNQAVAAARFGARVAFAGRVGDDAAGAGARAMLAGFGVDVTQLTVSALKPTGVGTIFLDPQGQNCIVVGAGANGEVDPAQARGWARRWSRHAVLLAQLELPVAAVRAAFEAFGGTRILNPAPAAADLAREPWDWVDVLTPNESEAKVMCGLAPDDPLAPRELIALLAERVAPRRLIVTVGADGALLWEDGQVTAVEALPVPVLDTTGAGDVFNGILAACLADGLSLKEAARRATVGASLSVQRQGVVQAAPDARTVERWLGHGRDAGP